MSSTLGPLPKTEWQLYMPAAEYERGWVSDQEGYTAEQMEAERLRCYELGVAQERERAANLAESYSDYFNSVTIIGPRIARSIRNPA